MQSLFSLISHADVIDCNQQEVEGWFDSGGTTAFLENKDFTYVFEDQQVQVDQRGAFSAKTVDGETCLVKFYELVPLTSAPEGEVTEIDEVVDAIYAANADRWPLTFQQAQALAVEQVWDQGTTAIVLVREGLLRKNQPMPTYLTSFACPTCGATWERSSTAVSDDECEQCGTVSAPVKEERQ